MILALYQATTGGPAQHDAAGLAQGDAGELQQGLVSDSDLLSSAEQCSRLLHCSALQPVGAIV